MKFLLDTHTFLFAISDPERLSTAVSQVLLDGDASKWLSAVSLWEIIIKVQVGKLILPMEPAYYLDNLRQLGASLLPVDAQHSFELIQLPLLHKDPFDRLLIAQARVEKMTLLTRDNAIQQYPVTTLW
jgi:PIN domain nuclease of toxin-antitoxin system